MLCCVGFNKYFGVSLAEKSCQPGYEQHSLTKVKLFEICIAFGVFGVPRVASILELQPEIWRMMDSISLSTLVISESIVNEFYFYNFPQTD